MSAKRFHVKRSSTSTVLWIVLCATLLAMGLIWFLVTGSPSPLAYCLSGIVIGYWFARWRNRRDVIEYVLDSDRMVLRRKGIEEVVPYNDLVDANLVDLSTARGYVRQHPATSAPSGIDSVALGACGLTLFCGVPIANSGIGPWIEDQFGSRMSRTRSMLVLLRLRDGRELLLSPRSGEDMVHAIGRALHPTGPGLV